MKKKIKKLKTKRKTAPKIKQKLLRSKKVFKPKAKINSFKRLKKRVVLANALRIVKKIKIKPAKSILPGKKAQKPPVPVVLEPAGEIIIPSLPEIAIPPAKSEPAIGGDADEISEGKSRNLPKAFEISVEDEVIEMAPIIGDHEPSVHVLDLHLALPGRCLRSGRDHEIKNFFEPIVVPERPNLAKRITSFLRALFADERDFKVFSPGRPRLLDEVKDELLVVNLCQVALTAVRWVFAGYFYVLVFLAERVLSVSKKRSRTRVSLTAQDSARVIRIQEPRYSMPVFREEPVAWRTNFGFFRIAPPLRFERTLATFVLLAFVFILPLRLVSTYKEVKNTKSVFMEKSVHAFEALNNSWSQVNNLESAALAFEKASSGFDEVLADVEETHRVLQGIAKIFPQGEELEAGKALLQAGSMVSAAAEVLAGRLATLDDTLMPPAERIHLMGESLRTALPLLESSREKLDSISIGIIPEQFRPSAKLAVGLLGNVVDAVESAETATFVLEDVFGRIAPRRFLVVFQNNTELRPTGGFMGSFAEIDTLDGNVSRMWMPGGGSYELQGSLRAVLVPPEPLQLIASRWEFQDSNWFPDFPSSAQKIMWFYEKGGGPTVDGVIAITTEVVEKILKVVGPIDMPEYGRVITADNFWVETQKAVELEYDREENLPKKFLADLAPKLLERLQSKDPKIFFGLAQALNESINEKHFQIYMRGALMQEKVVHLGWSGDMKKTAGDMLAVVNSNIAGGKTDDIVSEHIKHVARVETDGRVVVTVEVTRTHHGIKGELFRGVRNNDYVRIYAPEGSTLIRAEGFKRPDPAFFQAVDEKALLDADLAASDVPIVTDPVSGTRTTRESGHTVFGNWIMVDPGGSVTYKVIYELPFRISFNAPAETFFEKIGLKEPVTPQAVYSFLLVKQAGTVATTFENEVVLPPNWKTVWNYPAAISNPAKLDRDRFFGMVLEPAEDAN